MSSEIHNAPKAKHIQIRRIQLSDPFRNSHVTTVPRQEELSSQPRLEVNYLELVCFTEFCTDTLQGPSASINPIPTMYNDQWNDWHSCRNMLRLYSIQPVDFDSTVGLRWNLN